MHTHTHTYTHTYIYIYIVIHNYLFSVTSIKNILAVILVIIMCIVIYSVNFALKSQSQNIKHPEKNASLNNLEKDNTEDKEDE